MSKNPWPELVDPARGSSTLCDTKRLPPVNHFTRAIIHNKKTHFFVKQKLEMSLFHKQNKFSGKIEKPLFAKNIHRTEGSDPRYDGFGGLGNCVNFFQDLEKTSFLPEQFEANCSQSCFQSFALEISLKYGDFVFS